MLRVVRTLIYEYESKERMEDDMKHWNVNGTFEVTPFNAYLVGRDMQPRTGRGMRITSTHVIEEK